MSSSRDCRFDVGEITLSGIESQPKTAARGLIVAIHGAGYTSRYWDSPHAPGDSLLRMGSDLGFRVIAIDRPGYGASRGAPDRELSLDGQVATLARFLAEIGELSKVPIFLIGHSLGSLIAVQLAADDRSNVIAGLDVMGLPFQWRSDVRAAVEAWVRGEMGIFAVEEARRSLYFGPAGTYDPRVLQFEASFSQRVPKPELAESLESSFRLDQFALGVRVPVQYTVAQFESSITGGVQALNKGASMFKNSPRVVTHLQLGTGHNISLHRVGRAYHMRALAFFDEVLAGITISATDEATDEHASAVTRLVDGYGAARARKPSAVLNRTIQGRSS